MRTRRLAWSFVAMEAGEPWASFFSYLRLPHVPAADFVVDDQLWTAYAHDWRTEPPLAWLEAMAEREISQQPLGDEPPQGRVAPVVLAEPDFAAAVRQGLRDYSRPERLAANPLTRSRLVLDRTADQTADRTADQTADRTAEQTPSEALRRLLLQTAEQLTQDPRRARLYRALDRTYFRPAATQERAAEVLQLPFSTYRSHLVAGTSALVDLLWQLELYGSDPGPTTGDRTRT